ncbi:MAG: phenylalanine--tRNA ligase subunit beta [Firmicutes bacterium]|nr:phenylalanine--tRNA ligase subunit beta [Bacillota bacterium]
MNLPISWLKEYVDLDCTTQEFMDEITLSGSKVESLTVMGKDIDGIITGKVLEIERHPDADKLVVTQIDVGNGEPLQIVTGASNLKVGDIVPVAMVNSNVYHGSELVKIKKGKLRGVESNGMLCSIEELGFTRHDYPEAPENGIYVFTEEVPLGADVKELLQINDEVVEFEITSNRPDCFSITGLARETAATFRKPFKFPEIKVEEKGQGNAADMISVEIKNSELCPRYIARAVKNVKIGPSPLWMRHRLTAAGVRPINNIVDITNYVMLEIGQPMHAFDIDCIKDRKIIVRNANAGEKIVTLDGQERELDPSMLVIADSEKAVAVAGVMGGENSMITEGAEAILFESANFNGPNVRITAKKLGLRTDASAKYEKGLDPNLSIIAVNRAVQLVEMLGCGEVCPGMVDCYPNVRTERTLEYSPESINKLLGTNISSEEMTELFKLIEVKADGSKDIIPTFRPDLESEADLAEEIARFYGYDKIESTLAAGTPTVGKKSYSQQIEDKIKNTMVAMGLCESMNYSFESPKVFDKLNIPADSDLRKTVKISNPLGEDFSIMRTLTLNGMLTSLATNFKRHRNESAGLFEIGKIYIPKALPLTELPDELPKLTIGMFGSDVDFFGVKGIVEELFGVLGIKDAEYSANKELTYMHPGRTADIAVNGENIGFVGQLHPAVAENYGIGTEVYIAVVDINALVKNADFDRVYKALPKFPAVERDIAMLVKDEIPVKAIEDVLRAKGGKFLEDIRLFDVYKGKQIETGFKSVAYSLFFRAPDKTLTDEEISSPMKKILSELEEKLGATLREQ